MLPQHSVLGSISGNRAFNYHLSPYQRGKIIRLTHSSQKSTNIQSLLNVSRRAKVEINWQRGRFDFKVSDWRGTVGAAHRVEALGLDSGEVPGNSLVLLFGGVLLLLI